MEELKYGSWSVKVMVLSGRYGVSAVEYMALNGNMSLPLRVSQTGFASFEVLRQEGSTAKVQEGIGGVCLYDRRWSLIFGGRQDKDPSVTRSLTLPGDRRSAEKLINKGRHLKAMLVPKSPSIAYHTNLVSWQVAVAQRYGLRRMFYHIPRAEYHAFIEQVELLANVSIPEAHAKLNEFTDTVGTMVHEAFGAAGIELKLLNPMEEQGAEDPLESFLHPYRYPERHGIDLERVIGIEDLPEVRLELEARNTRPGMIDMALCVLKTPHPYVDACPPDVYEITL